MGIFRVEGKFYQFTAKLMELVKLSLLWMVCSLPLVTMGAATTAAMRVALTMVDDEESHVGQMFWQAFRSNLRQGIGAGVLLSVAWYAVYLDFQLFHAIEGNPLLLLLVGMLSTGFLAFATIYTFPLLARYENTVMGCIKNSLHISRRYFGRTLLLLGLVLLEICMFQWNWTMMLIGVLFGPGVIVYTIAAMCKPIFLSIERDNQ